MNSGTRAVLHTEHFAFHYRAGSVAERNIALLDTRLVAVRDATLDLLALASVQVPIAVYLLDGPDDEVPPEESVKGEAKGSEPRATDSLGEGSEARPVPRALTGIYQEDAPGNDLARSLVELLIATSPDKQVAPAGFIVDGVL